MNKNQIGHKMDLLIYLFRVVTETGKKNWNTRIWLVGKLFPMSVLLVSGQLNGKNKIKVTE